MRHDRNNFEDEHERRLLQKLYESMSFSIPSAVLIKTLSADLILGQSPRLTAIVKTAEIYLPAMILTRNQQLAEDPG
jgi:hypothetical protein